MSGAGAFGSVGLEVDRAGLAALVGLEVVANALVGGEAGQPGALERADMDERVLAAVLGRDEAVALLGVEEFHFTGDHGIFLLKARRKWRGLRPGRLEKEEGAAKRRRPSACDRSCDVGGDAGAECKGGIAAATQERV